ncbi:MAG: hypothetical protein ACXAEE_12535 [Candidatus Thorarchaeota archaeon]|jgi:hypothetical protein
MIESRRSFPKSNPIPKDELAFMKHLRQKVCTKYALTGLIDCHVHLEMATTLHPYKTYLTIPHILLWILGIEACTGSSNGGLYNRQRLWRLHRSLVILQHRGEQHVHVQLGRHHAIDNLVVRDDIITPTPSTGGDGLIDGPIIIGVVVAVAVIAIVIVFLRRR